MNEGQHATTDAASPVRLEVTGHVAEIALEAGPLNLVTRELLRALHDALRKVSAHPDVRCVILHGGDARAFCAGSDMKEFAAIRHEASERKILFEDMVVRSLAGIEMPTIAAIDAPALGGGFELALACDLRILRRGATVALPETRIGGLAANGAVRLTRLVGPSRAKELLFTGAAVPAEQALAWGLVNRVTEGSALEEARKLAAEIATRGPLSNRFAKELVNLAQDGPLDAALSQSTVLQQRIFDSDDLHRGVAAFFDKGEPVFRAR